MTGRGVPEPSEPFHLDFAFVLMVLVVAVVIAALTWELWMPH
jgi:hypothetical protein